ncbi:MAG: hypothetical protein Q4F21_12540, partial [Lachnospiraceae bacterium]|nr:hypothetical protein [Lachnospiraceae bacterium]
MKKTLVFGISLMLLLSMAGCASESETAGKEESFLKTEQTETAAGTAGTKKPEEAGETEGSG